MKFFYHSLALCLLVSCTKSTKPVLFSDTAKLSLSLTSNRSLELEPCGCTTGPMGGMAREFNALTDWRKTREVLAFSSGLTFYPDPQHWSKPQPELTAKAKTMAKALNALGTQAVALSVNDLRLTLPKLREVKTLAHFPFLTTNLRDRKTHKPIFESKLELNAGGLNLLVLSAAGKGSPNFSDVSFERVEPGQAAREVLKSLPVKPRFIVVLSSMNEKERAVFLKAVPETNLVLGNDADASLPIALGPKTVFASTINWGRALMRIDLEGPKEFSGIYGDSLYSQSTQAIDSVKSQLGKTLLALDEPMKASRKKELTAEKKALESQLAQFGEPSTSGPTTLNLTSEYLPLGGNLDSPRNIVHELITGYHSEVRQISLSELD